MAGEHIVDAEWEEVPGNHARIEDRRSEKQDAASPPQPTPKRRGWLARELARSARWRYAATAGLSLLIIGMGVRVDSVNNQVRVAAANTNTDQIGDTSPEAAQMLSRWAQIATGAASTTGFTLINGGGKPGEFCSSASGPVTLNFGGQTLPKEHAQSYNFFSRTTAGSDTGVGGLFEFDEARGELRVHDRIEGSIRTDEHHRVADITMKVTAIKPGIVVIDGTRYHACVL